MSFHLFSSHLLVGISTCWPAYSRNNKPEERSPAKDLRWSVPLWVLEPCPGKGRGLLLSLPAVRPRLLTVPPGNSLQGSSQPAAPETRGGKEERGRRAAACPSLFPRVIPWQNVDAKGPLSCCCCLFQLKLPWSDVREDRGCREGLKIIQRFCSGADAQKCAWRQTWFIGLC